MRLTCPAGSVRPQPLLNTPHAPHSQHHMQHHLAAMTSSFRQFKDQSQRLTNLYQISKHRNNQLTQLSLNLSRDINFLKHYCLSLERELQELGYYQTKHFDMLSRKETAATIFQSYSDSSSLLSECWSSRLVEEELAELRNRNLNLQIQNQKLGSKVPAEAALKIHKAIQVNNTDQQRLRREYQHSEQKVSKLTDEVRELKKINGALQYEQKRKNMQTSIMSGREQIFNKIHQLIGQYKKKIRQLAHEKVDVEKKYRLLKEKIHHTETGNNMILIDMLTEKIDILQKLTEKQQIQIENTIDLYDTELCKIEERRKEEFEYFQNQRISLENENLRLCMDLQKVLNKVDQANLQLFQEKNKVEILKQDIIRITSTMEFPLINDKANKHNKCKLISGNIKFYGQNFKRDYFSPQVKQPYQSAIYNHHDENSNTSNYEYQFSEIEESNPILSQLKECSSIKEGHERSLSKQKTMRQKIKITYNPPNLVDPSYSKPCQDKNHEAKSVASKRIAPFHKKLFQGGPSLSNPWHNKNI